MELIKVLITFSQKIPKMFHNNLSAYFHSTNPHLIHISVARLNSLLFVKLSPLKSLVHLSANIILWYLSRHPFSSKNIKRLDFVLFLFLPVCNHKIIVIPKSMCTSWCFQFVVLVYLLCLFCCVNYFSTLISDRLLGRSEFSEGM